jgi:hypothetical protein
MLDADRHADAGEPPVEATLVLDSRTGASRLGMRSGGTADRRLLFHAACAHIELRIAPSRDEKHRAWLHGLFVVPSAAGSVGRVRVVLTTNDAPVEVETIETGEFALPCDPSQPIALQFLPPQGAAVRVRIDS